MASRDRRLLRDAPRTSRKLSPILAGIGARLSHEYLLQLPLAAEPGHAGQRRACTVQGMTGAATTSYSRPRRCTSSRLPPYRPSTIGAAHLVACRDGRSSSIADRRAARSSRSATPRSSQRADPLLDRVGGFVSMHAGTSRTLPSARAERRDARQAGASDLLRGAVDCRRSGDLDRAARASTLELADIDGDRRSRSCCSDRHGDGHRRCSSSTSSSGRSASLVGLVDVPFAARASRSSRRSNRKRRAFAEQLPDNLDVLASALRAGHSLVSALAVVADDAAEPSKSEFRRVARRGAVRRTARGRAQGRRRCAWTNRDLEQVALVARLQREMGSNSAEVLDRVIETVRGRMELRRLVRTLTAQGRLSRWILTRPADRPGAAHHADRPAATCTRSSTRRSAESLLVVAVCMVALGSFVIGKIIDIKA